MARGRKPVVLDKNEFQNVVREVESKQTFSTRQALWQAVCETQWATSLLPRPLQPATAMAKAKDFALEIHTPVGKRGRAKGCARPENAGGKKRKGMSEETFFALSSGVPAEERAMPYMKKLLLKVKERRTLSSLVKLKCLECTNYQRAEISGCELRGCALWSVRPYKGDKGVAAWAGDKENFERESVRTPLTMVT